jgi:hypothetical protein
MIPQGISTCSKASRGVLSGLLCIILVTTACQAVDIGIERSTPLVETVYQDASTVTRTPPTDAEALKATVSALATQNAQLATRVGAHTTVMPLATPTFAPIAQPNGIIGYPFDTRTGISVLDAIISAVLADDLLALTELVHYTVTACTHEPGMGGPPKCKANEQEEALVEVFPVLGPEGMHLRRENIETAFPRGNKTLYAVFRVPDGAYEEDYWPAGQYGIIFLDGDPTHPTATTFLADAGGIVRIVYYQSLPRSLELEHGIKVNSFILPPSAGLIPTATLTPPSLAAIPPGFWTQSETSPSTLVAVLNSSDVIAQPFNVASPHYAGYGDIATMYLDGTHSLQLTTYRYNADPVLSPDRQHIAYRSVPSSITSLPDPGPRLGEHNYNIWVIATDGTQARQLTSSELWRGVPVWSPDSQRVAFVEGSEGLLVEIQVDTQERRENVRGASWPRYRPDGNGIAYITMEGGLVWLDNTGTVHSVIPAETLPENIRVLDFDWLPDSEHIVFTLSERKATYAGATLGFEYAVWAVQADGSALIKLADDLHDVRISPDGQVIAALEGSGYADACFVDQRLRFLLLAPDLTSARQVEIENFAGYPPIDRDQTFYPVSTINWVSNRLALGSFDLTCTTDPKDAGRYVIDALDQSLHQVTRQ